LNLIDKTLLDKLDGIYIAISYKVTPTIGPIHHTHKCFELL